MKEVFGGIQPRDADCALGKWELLYKDVKGNFNTYTGKHKIAAATGEITYDVSDKNGKAPETFWVKAYIMFSTIGAPSQSA